jgi:ketosteroid isomerase-like protein
MVRLRKFFALLVLLLVVPLFAQGQKTRSRARAYRENPSDTLTASLLQVDRDLAKAGAAKNLDSFMGYVTEDVRFYAAGVMRTGKLAFREGWAKGFADPAWSITWAPLYAEAAQSSELGYTTGSFEIHDKAADGTPVVRKGSYVTIWRKQPDGSWKVALDIGSFVPAKPAATQSSPENH